MTTLNVKNLPDGLYRKLSARARRHHRSIAQEVTHILTGAVAEPVVLSVLELRALGNEAWDGVDAGKHVARERRSWG